MACLGRAHTEQDAASAATEGTVHVSLNKLIQQTICTEPLTTEGTHPARKLLQMFLLKNINQTTGII